MFYSQGLLNKINDDVIVLHNSEREAIKSAKRMLKDKDYSKVWYGSTEKRTEITNQR